MYIVYSSYILYNYLQFCNYLQYENEIYFLTYDDISNYIFYPLYMCTRDGPDFRPATSTG